MLTLIDIGYMLDQSTTIPNLHQLKSAYGKEAASSTTCLFFYSQFSHSGTLDISTRTIYANIKMSKCLLWVYSLKSQYEDTFVSI